MDTKNTDFKSTIKYDQKDIEKKVFALMDEYQKQNSLDNREFLCYLTAAIYLTYRELFPQLSVYIPFRTKSDISFIKNIQKEFNKFVLNFDPNNPQPFDTTEISKDISGIKIILDDINYSRPASNKSALILNDENIQKLSPHYKENPEDISNFEFIAKVQNYIYSPTKTSKDFYKLKEELLRRIIKLTPKEFTEERQPRLSFSELYRNTIYEHNYYSENNNFPVKISDKQIEELNDLLDNLRSISNDQYHFAILNKTLPIVLSHPLISKTLGCSFEKVKEVKKPNAFQAIYYTLHTPFGNIEMQSQSNKAHYASTKGSAYHSGLAGKAININDFFELVDPNDEHDLSYYTDFLDSYSADALSFTIDLPEFRSEQDKQEFFETEDGKTYKATQECLEKIKHIKIKDRIEINGSAVDTNDYFLSTAISFSPYMNVCGSGHTSTTTAAIHHKNVVDEFSEILRKKDCNTCLRELLIRRMELLIENDGILDDPSEKISKHREASLNFIKEHEETARKLPKDISKKEILKYSEKKHIFESPDLSL